MKALTAQEAAKRLGISDRHVRRMAQAGDIPAFLLDRRWRIPDGMLDEWLRRQCGTDHSIPRAQ